MFALELLAASVGIGPVGIAPSRWASRDDYPVAAWQAHQQGAVMIELWLNNAGYPYHCRIVASSSVDALDHQSCAVMLRNARYHPARDEAGKTIASVSRRVLSWSLNDLPPPVAPPGYDVEISVTNLPSGAKNLVVPIREVRRPDDTVESCAAGRDDLNDKLVALACASVANLRGPPVVDNQSQRTRYVRVIGVRFVIGSP